MALSMLATHFPECTSVGMITAVTVFGSGEKSDMSNDTGITVRPVFAMITERRLASRADKHGVKARAAKQACVRIVAPTTFLYPHRQAETC